MFRLQRHILLPIVVGAGIIFYACSLMIDSSTTLSVTCDTPSFHPPVTSKSTYLARPATARFRDSLREDANYITSWSNGGFTNEFMSYVNMIYLGTLSDRIPIIPPFWADHHIPSLTLPLPFREVFDLDGLRSVLHTPILEWSDIQGYSDSSTSPVEHLGCWSARAPGEKEPVKAEGLMNHLNLDVSYTRVPPHVRRSQPTHDSDTHVVFWPLASLIFPIEPSDPAWSYPHWFPSPSGSTLSPDEHMTCIDSMYYATAGRNDFEWDYSWSPAWRFVGRNLRFTKSLRDLGESYARRALDIPQNSELPPFVSVHIRRGDFASQCRPEIPADQCFPPISAYARRIQEVKDELLHKNRVAVTNVIVTSDEVDPKFWDEVVQLGWTYVNHKVEKTLEKHGEWYAPLVDVVVQSMGRGFVGTDQSTVSLVSKRRVEDWNNGVTRLVALGPDVE